MRKGAVRLYLYEVSTDEIAKIRQTQMRFRELKWYRKDVHPV